LRLLAVIPAYNEAASIQRVVADTIPFVDTVLVVDDGSRDDTATLARQAGAQVHAQPRNMGKGAALQAGMDYCLEHGFDVAVTLDADGQHEPRSIPDLAEPIRSGRADMSVGSRKQQMSTHMPFIRRFTNRFMSWMLGLVAGQPMEDTQSGYRAISAPVLRGVRVSSSHFEAESEFLLKAARLGFRIAWIPIATIYGGRPSHIHPIHDTARFFRMMWNVLRAPSA